MGVLSTDEVLEAGRAIEQAGIFRSARAMYRSGLQYAPSNKRLLLATARAHVKAGEGDCARECLESALEHHADDPDVLYVYAENRFQASKYNKALQAFRKLLERIDEGQEAAGTLSKLSYRAASCNFKLGDLDAAKKWIGAAIQHKADSAQYHYLLGEIIEEQDEKSLEPAKAYEKVLELRPTHFNARLKLARLYRGQGDRLKARLHYSYIVKTQPQSSTYWNELGLVSDRHEALRHYEKALEFKPDDAVIKHNVAFSLEEQGRDLERAERLLREACAANPDGHDFNGRLASLLVKRGNKCAAEAFYKASIKKSPTKSESVIAYAQFLQNEKRFKDGAMLCMDALRLMPESQEVRLCLATCLEKAGKCAQALYYLVQLSREGMAGIDAKIELLKKNWQLTELSNLMLCVYKIDLNKESEAKEHIKNAFTFAANPILLLNAHKFWREGFISDDALEFILKEVVAMLAEWNFNPLNYRDTLFKFDNTGRHVKAQLAYVHAALFEKKYKCDGEHVDMFLASMLENIMHVRVADIRISFQSFPPTWIQHMTDMLIPACGRELAGDGTLHRYLAKRDEFLKLLRDDPLLHTERDALEFVEMCDVMIKEEGHTSPSIGCCT